jgi:hypothetical protein
LSPADLPGAAFTIAGLDDISGDRGQEQLFLFA